MFRERCGSATEVLRGSYRDVTWSYGGVRGLLPGVVRECYATFSAEVLGLFHPRFATSLCFFYKLCAVHCFKVSNRTRGRDMSLVLPGHFSLVLSLVLCTAL